MRLYRISRSVYANKLDGQGAEKYGGRWNKAGIPMIYTSSTRALAVLEIMVGLPNALIPSDFVMIELEIPDKSITSLNKDKLPIGWDRYPAMGKTMQLGTDWIIKNETFALEVPSSIINEESNYLINPRHHQIKEVKIISLNKFDFDQRLMKMIDQ